MNGDGYYEHGYIDDRMAFDLFKNHSYWDESLNNIAMECSARYMANYGDGVAFYDLLYWLVYGIQNFTIHMDLYRAYDVITASTVSRLLRIAESRLRCPDGTERAMNIRTMLRNDFAQRLTMLCYPVDTTPVID